jgi:predicted GNAT superfamily acetyltransferase
MTLNLILGAAASLSLCMLVLAAFYKAGEKIGYGKGYDQGRLVADNWWLGVELEVDQARVAIWRDEAQR